MIPLLGNCNRIVDLVAPYSKTVNSETSPFVGSRRAHPLRAALVFPDIDTEDSRTGTSSAIRQLHNHVCDIPRVAFRSPLRPSQHFQYRTDEASYRQAAQEH